MKTDFKNISLFEAAMVSWSLIGVVLIAMVTFSSLTPEKQYQVKKSFEIFDIHTETREAMETIYFVLDIPGEFYEEFYIAFVEVTTLPEYTFELPVQIASDVSMKFGVVLDNLSEQVAEGYQSHNQALVARAQSTEPQYDGKVMGAMIEISEELETWTVLPQKARVETLEIPYSYDGFNLNQLKIEKMLAP